MELLPPMGNFNSGPIGCNNIVSTGNSAVFILIVLTCNQQTFRQIREETFNRRYLYASEYIAECSSIKYQGLLYVNDVSYLWQLSPPVFVQRSKLDCMVNLSKTI